MNTSFFKYSDHLESLPIHSHKFSPLRSLSDVLAATEEDIIRWCSEGESITAMGASLIRISEDIVIKVGGFVFEKEAACQQHVFEHLPNNSVLRVPKIYRTFIREHNGYIVMEYIPGGSLDHTWEQLSPPQREDCSRAIACAIKELHTIQAPQDYPPGPILRRDRTFESKIRYHEDGTAIPILNKPRKAGRPQTRSWDDTPIERKPRGHLFNDCHTFRGPFASLEELENWCNDRLASLSKPLISLANLSLSMCHMDIAPRNIILKNDNVYLIDWAWAGFYPPIFEISAIQHHQRHNSDDSFYTNLLSMTGLPLADPIVNALYFVWYYNTRAGGSPPSMKLILYIQFQKLTRANRAEKTNCKSIAQFLRDARLDCARTALAPRPNYRNRVSEQHLAAHGICSISITVPSP